MLATKKLLQQNEPKLLEEALSDETDILIKHWISEECQKNFENYS